MMVRKAVIVGLLVVVTFTVAGLGREIIITNTTDSGLGTFRWALQTARSGDVITFDPEVFPPDAPATIQPETELPAITGGNVTIDASNAGVILDGDRMPERFAHALEVHSDGNVIMGLQIVRFVGAGLAVCSGSHNTIGGDRSTGVGPVGQGNVFSGNGMGIDLCDPGTSGNTILWNLIGVRSNGTTPFGNAGSGIFIEPGVIDSHIGPGNVVAYNGVCGVEVFGDTSLRNTLTGNAIFGNERGGIALIDGGNGLPDAPELTDIDSLSGFVAGTAPPNSTVEIFSDRAGQGETLEGTALTDDRGAFSIEIGRELAGPNITATATITDGSTSPFSHPFESTRTRVVMQTTASGLRRSISTHSEANRRSSQFTTGLWSGLWQAAAYEWDLDQLLQNEVLAMGPTAVRLAVNSLDVPTVNWLEEEWPVSDAYNAWVTSLAENGVAIRYGLTFWDKEGQAAGEPAPCNRFTTERDIQRYLDYVQDVVSHFSGRVVSFELWNEPNVSACRQHIAVESYIELVRRAAPVIRELAPEAEIIIGSVTPFIDCDGYEYLHAVVSSDVLPLVDAISWHVGAPSPQFDEWREICETYPSLMRTIVKTARSNGFVGRFIADELNWRSALNPHPYGGEPWAYTPTTAAKYYARGTLTNLGIGFDVGFAELSSTRETVFSTVKHLCLALGGTEAVRINPLIDIDYDGPVAYCAFRYPNGDRILAVWTDGIAQDEDPGVPATITFPGLTAETVTGIDVLHGFKQELAFEIDGDDTIIRDLLVKDYPILIRLSDVTTGPDYEETVGDGFHRLGDVDAVPSSTGGGSDRDGDGVPDDED